VNKNYKKLLLTGLLAFGANLSAMDGSDVNPSEKYTAQLIRELGALANPHQSRRAIIKRRLPDVLADRPFSRPLFVSGISLRARLASKETELSEVTIVAASATSGPVAEEAATGSRDFGSESTQKK